jgi:putative nucleotidyltransferase with HDIG domain
MRIPGIVKLLGEGVYSILKNSTTHKVIGVLFFFSTTILILFSHFSPNQVTLKPDEVAQRNIQSHITAVVIDEKQTQELKEQAASKVQKVYQEDKFASANTQADITDFYSSIREILGSEGEKQVSLEVLISSYINGKEDILILSSTPTQMVDYITGFNDEDLNVIEQISVDIAKGIMDRPITEETLNEAFLQAQNQINSLNYYPIARDFMKIATVSSIRPNLIFNQEATDLAIKEAIESVQPVQKTIKTGEIIVREGDRVTAEQIAILEQLGIQRSKSYPITLIGIALFVLLTFWLAIEFIKRFYKDIFDNDKLMLLLGLIFIITISLTRFLTLIKFSGQPEMNALIGYLAPVAAGSMLTAILLDNRLAFFMTIIMALYVGLLTEGNQLFYVITAFVGGTVGIYQVYRLSQTSDLVKSGLYISLANIVSIITLSFIGGNTALNILVLGILIGAVNGVVSAVLMIGVLPYLESAFSITSMIKLLELANPNHYLLKRLLLVAPGTYHHSLMVGNLAEASAEAIGANPLLVRVGSYYHDIGKIKRPEYFVENQRSFDNPHERIAPALSALIINSHVKEGVELAREAKLPQVIINFIEQHHGTSLIKYFYRKALEEDREGNINDEGFRYEGPKPQSKELALVMLADSVEASVRSLQDPSSEKIEAMVHAIIKDKLNDGQLEACDLTFRDLDILYKSFVKILEGVYHKRIEYPDTIVREFEKRREIHGYHGNKPAE